MHGQPRVQRLLAGTGETFNLIIITFILINIITIITIIIIIVINGIILIIMLATRAGHQYDLQVTQCRQSYLDHKLVVLSLAGEVHFVHFYSLLLIFHSLPPTSSSS